MENVKVFIEEAVSLDQEFLELERRANRNEMCQYRNAIIEERERRKKTFGASSEKVFVADKEPRPKFLTVGHAILAILDAGIVIYSFRLAVTCFRGGEIFFGIIGVLIGLYCLVMALREFLRFRGIDISIASKEEYQQFVENLKREKELSESTNRGGADDAGVYSQLKKDSDTVLFVKQNRLDSLLGF